MKKIEVVIGKDGNVFLEAKGFKGQACLTATKEILDKLGGEQEMTKKTEWYQETDARIKINTKGV